MDILGKARIAELEESVWQMERELAALTAQAQALVQVAHRQADLFPRFFATKREENLGSIRSAVECLPLESSAGWDDSRWTSWQCGSVLEEPRIRVGDLLDRSDTLLAPAYVPFIGQNRTVIVRTRGAASARGIGLLQSLAIRTAVLFPHLARHALLDPAGNGANFPMQSTLPRVRPHGPDPRRELDDILDHIRRILQTLLSPTVGSFESIAPDQRVNEYFEFVFAADFPNQYSYAAIEALANVGITGPKAGVYLFVHYNQDHPLPRGMTLDSFRNAYFIELEETKPGAFGRFKLKPEGAPPPSLQEGLLATLARAKPPERVIDWERTVGLPESEWWKGDASEIIETPIGLLSNGSGMRLWFGVDNGHPCVHGVLGAMPGAGKSTLYHNSICGLAIRYSPSELRFYLIDGKSGVEFQFFRELPQAEVVSLQTPPELARSVLTELVAEIDRRFSDLFIPANVQDLTAYRRSGQSTGTLPRILLLIDEYQDLFRDDRDGSASASLLYIAEKGRAAGVHMFLGSHGFDAPPGMLNRNRIFEDIHLRVAMAMSGAAVQSLTDFQRDGKSLISTCDLPGKLVINDDTGKDPHSRAGKGAWLTSDQRDGLLAKLQARGQALPAGSLPSRVVFDGGEQPILLDNPAFSLLLHRPTRPTPQELQDIARTSVAEGGLGMATWFAAEQPCIAWLGQEFNVRGQAHIVFRRATAENATIVGSENGTRFGMAVALLASLAVNLSPDHLRFAVVDKSIPGAPCLACYGTRATSYSARRVSMSASLPKTMKPWRSWTKLQRSWNAGAR